MTSSTVGKDGRAALVTKQSSDVIEGSGTEFGGVKEALKWCRTEIFALCEVTEDSYQEMADDTDDGKQGSFARGRVAEAKSIRKAMGEVISERLRDLSPNGDAE